VKKKLIKPRGTDQELLPCMDYLHGDVVDHQVKAACHYEYARECAVLRRAAELFSRDPTAYIGEISLKIEDEFHCGSLFIGIDWMFVWQCPSFPAKSWNQLSEAERTELLCGLPLATNKARPLVLAEVMFLTRILDELKKIAAKGRKEWKKQVTAVTRAARARADGKKKIPSVIPRQKFYPILELPNTPFVQVLLPLDFSKTRNRLLQEIDLWLKLPENQARFDKYKPRTETGTEKEAKDRLKDLAAWRLYRQLGSDGALQFAERNRKRDERGTARPFHDPRQDQTKKVSINEAPLYSEESGFSKAKARAEDHLGKLLPGSNGEVNWLSGSRTC